MTAQNSKTSGDPPGVARKSMEQTKLKIVRTPKTWLVYLLLSLYAYCLNVPGPIAGYLRDEFHMNYTASSMHFSAFALGILVTGLFGGTLIRRMGHWKVMAIGAIGLGVGGLILSFGRVPALTVTGLFLMGCIGTWILSIYPAILDEEMGAGSPVGISEANVTASIFASLAPLLVGYLASQAVGWRLAVITVALVSLGLGLWLFITATHQEVEQAEQPTGQQKSGRLPARYWVLWLALVLGISIEFCTIYWGSDFIEKVLGLTRDTATQTVSLFLIGMIIGRFFGGRLLQRISARNILVGSILLGVVGFGLFWTGLNPVVGLIGLFLMGLGVANFYPTILSLAIKSAGAQKGLAGSRATLASGVAIFFLPLILGTLADGIGIKPAFAIVGGLFVLLAVMLVVADRMKGSWQAETQERAD
ncbi:MAG: MFS transporter [Anaerolineaceae bacterium]